MTIPAVITVPRTELLIGYIRSLGWDCTQEVGYPPYPGPEILTAPDKALFLTPTPGPGYRTEEGGVDSWGFQARVRGPFDDPLGAEGAAQLLDWMILNGPHPVQVCGVNVLNVQRLGASPVPLPLDPSDRRFQFTCTYVMTTGA